MFLRFHIHRYLMSEDSIVYSFCDHLQESVGILTGTPHASAKVNAINAMRFLTRRQCAFLSIQMRCPRKLRGCYLEMSYFLPTYVRYCILPLVFPTRAQFAPNFFKSVYFKCMVFQTFRHVSLGLKSCATV